MTPVDQILGWPAFELSAALDAGAITSLDLTRAYLARIQGLNPRLNAYLCVLPEMALQAAENAALRASQGRRLGPLDGMPIAVKDNIDVKGVPTTAGMDCRRSPPAGEDAQAVRLLRASGAVILGKTNMDEAAMGGTSDNPFFGRTHHPLKHGYTPGGSSGGSAAAVAANLCAAALGTDTLGSLRIPASYCGVAALKPTFGLVSTRGVCPLCHRLDHVGPIARAIEDLQLILDVIGRYDPACPDARAAPADLERPQIKPLAACTIGTLRNLEEVAAEPAVRAAYAAALGVLASLGCRVQSVDLQDYDPAAARRSGLLCGEADAANTHAAFLGESPPSLSREVRALISYGRDVSGARLARAHRHLDLIAFEFRALLRSVDVVVTATTPQAAFPFDQPVPGTQGDMTALANISGCPALTIPMGTDPAGLPLGLQFIGRAHAEATLFAIAGAFLKAAGTKHPLPDT